MAREVMETPIHRVHGRYTKDGTVHRTKMYKTPDGKIIREGVEEGYKIEHPRNYKKKPPKGDELANIQLFKQASLLTTKILKSPECAQQRREYEDRFSAQFKHPDPLAPIDKNTRKPKQYIAFNTFVRAMVYMELKQAQNG